MRKGIAALVAIATILSGCAPNIAGSGRPPAALVADDVYYDTQTIVGPCYDPAEAVPLLAALASAVISTGVNRIGDAIKAASETETRTVTARRNVELRQGEGLGPCVTVVRGWFYRNPPSFPDDPSPSPFAVNDKSKWPLSNAQEVAQFWRWGLHMASTPDFYFQGRIVASTDKTAYAVLPLAASLDRPLSSVPLRPGGQRSVLVSFAFSDVGKSADFQKVGGTTIVLGKMEPGRLLKFSSISCFAKGNGGSLESLRLTGDKCIGQKDFDTLIRSPFESEWFSVTLGEKSKPMMVQALVSETRSPSQFLAFVSDVFAASKGRIAEELQQELIPSIGDDSAEAALSAKEKLANDADTAQGKAITDLRACVAAPTDPAKRIAARASLRSFVQAARKAGRSTGVSSAQLDAITPGSDDAAPCQSALDAAVAS
jgi:hypothetical protein